MSSTLITLRHVETRPRFLPATRSNRSPPTKCAPVLRCSRTTARSRRPRALSPSASRNRPNGSVYGFSGERLPARGLRRAVRQRHQLLLRGHGLADRRGPDRLEACPGVQPTMTIDEQVECEQAVLASPEFKARARRSNTASTTPAWSWSISGAPATTAPRKTAPAGWPGRSASCARPDRQRLCPAHRRHPRPVVDLNPMQVIRVEEYGHWPLPPGSCNYAADRVPKHRTDIKPLDITQPRGAELRGRGQPGPLAEVELRHRLQRPRRPDAAPSPLRRRRPRTARFCTGRR